MPSPARRLTSVVLLAGVYLLAARVGLWFAVVHPNVSPVWPPTGVALAALVLGGMRLWPGITLGAFLANLATGAGALASAGIALGNTAEAVLGYLVLQRFGFDRQLGRQRDVLILLLGPAAAGAAVAATVGVLSLRATDHLGTAPLSTLWWLWWAGDAFSAFVVAPVILTWWSRPWRGARPRRSAEALLLGAAVATVGSLFFSGLVRLGDSPLSLAYTVFPIAVWAAIRFSQPGATAVNLAVFALSVWATIRGSGPFLQDTVGEGVVHAQVFVAVESITALLLGAATVRRREAEQALRLKSAQLAEVQRVAKVGGWEWDVASGHVWWSDELHALYGTTPATFGGTYDAFLDLVHPDDREHASAVVQDALRRGAAFEFEHRVARPDGSLRVVLGRGQAEADAGGVVRRMVGTGQDITERKQADDERAALQQAQAARVQAEEANRLKDEFLATLSHELRTPLNAIVGWASLMGSGGLDAATQQKAVQSISNAARALTQLIADVLDVSRISAGKVQLSLRAVELVKVVDAALDAVKPAASARRVALALDVDTEAARVAVLGDPDRLQQVIWNLVSNAVKFTPAEGSVTVRVTEEAGEGVVEVTDTGVGIPAAFLPHVFDRFRQADSGSRRAFGGLGLGLSIARHLAEAHGGRLFAASDGEGRGATFTLRVPALAAKASEGVRSEVSAADEWATAPRLGGVRVLAVEDDPASREMLGAMLRRLGAEVVLAQSASEGFAMVREYRPDVLLSDIEMPGESGYELMKRVRALPAADGGLTPAAAITAHVGPEDRVRALAAGFELHVAKPVQPTDVALAVAALAARVRR
jgi:PAS domain S-box-containing protein